MADFYIKRRGHIDVPELYRAPDASAYGDINWAGIVAFLAGLITGWSVEDGLVPALQGPISTGLLGGADMSWLVGILVSGALYLVLSPRTGNMAVAAGRAGG
jgi:nucleobase:cation symporter-1, NCS1 family